MDRLIRLLGRPTFLIPLLVAAATAIHFLATTHFGGSTPRTVPDRLILRHFPNIQRGLYGVKPHYVKIDDPVGEVE